VLRPRGEAERKNLANVLALDMTREIAKIHNNGADLGIFVSIDDGNEIRKGPGGEDFRRVAAG
jgi:hypothetical protein